MEFNTELILLSDDISTSIILPISNVTHSNVSCHFYNYSAFLLKVNLFNIHSNITFKRTFSKGFLIPQIDVKSNLLVKYYNIIPRLVYNLIKINKRLLYFNNNFLSKKND